MLTALTAALALTSQLASAWDNTPPIPDRLPMWTIGKGKQMIQFEIFYDLTCSGSAAMHPELKAFLDMPFLNGKVSDAITLNYAFFPLPYHHGTWIAHKLLPYIVD